jgi:RNA polymerase sigma factor (sigma-70 family)
MRKTSGLTALSDEKWFSVSDWYDSVRPSDFPKYKRIEGLAKKIWQKRRDDLEQGDFDCHVWATLRTNLGKFDPGKANPAKPADECFLWYFGYWFDKRISQAVLRLRAGKRKERVTLRSYAEEKVASRLGPLGLHAERYWEHARKLFWEVMESLDIVTKAYIKYRYLEELTLEEIAAKLKIPLRTLKRNLAKSYKLDNLVNLVRQRVRENISKMPRTKLYKAIYSLVHENDFSIEEVARLFCMPVEQVEGLHREMVCQLAASYDLQTRKRAS